MNITMLKKVKHKGVTYTLNGEYDLSEVLANDWIKSGYAEEVRGETPKTLAPKSRRPTRGGEMVCQPVPTEPQE